MLLQILAGLLTPDSGRLSFGAEVIFDMRADPHTRLSARNQLADRVSRLLPGALTPKCCSI